MSRPIKGKIVRTGREHMSLLVLFHFAVVQHDVLRPFRGPGLLAAVPASAGLVAVWVSI